MFFPSQITVSCSCSFILYQPSNYWASGRHFMNSKFLNSTKLCSMQKHSAHIHKQIMMLYSLRLLGSTMKRLESSSFEPLLLHELHTGAWKSKENIFCSSIFYLISFFRRLQPCVSWNHMKKTYTDVPDLMHCYTSKTPIANRQKYFCLKKKKSLFLVSSRNVSICWVSFLASDL